MGNNFSCFKTKKKKQEKTGSVLTRIRKRFSRPRPTKVIDVTDELQQINELGEKESPPKADSSALDADSLDGSGEGSPRLPSPANQPGGRMTATYRSGAVTPLPPDESMLEIIYLNTNTKSQEEDDVQPLPSRMPRPKAAKGMRTMPTGKDLAFYQAENGDKGKKPVNHLDRRLRPKAAKGARTPHVNSSMDLFLPGSTQNTKAFPGEDGGPIVPAGQILRQTEEQKCLNEWMRRCTAREKLEDF